MSMKLVGYLNNNQTEETSCQKLTIWKLSIGLSHYFLHQKKTVPIGDVNQHTRCFFMHFEKYEEVKNDSIKNALRDKIR